MYRFHFMCMLFFLMFACSDKAKEAKLEGRIAELEMRLDECRNGAEKIHAKTKLAYDKEEFYAVHSLYKDMTDRHPESALYPEVKSIYEKVVKAEEKKKAAEKRKADREKKNRLKALNRLKKEHDDVQDITWYKNPYFTHYTNTNYTSIYMGKSASIWLRLQMSYTGDDWIFFKQAYLSYDGKTQQIYFNQYREKQSDNGSGGVWEWIDVKVDDKLLEFLRGFSKSKNAKMRLSGQYTKTRKLSYNERRGIADVLAGYDVLKAEVK